MDKVSTVALHLVFCLNISAACAQSEATEKVRSVGDFYPDLPHPLLRFSRKADGNGWQPPPENLLKRKQDPLTNERKLLMPADQNSRSSQPIRTNVINEAGKQNSAGSKKIDKSETGSQLNSDSDSHTHTQANGNLISTPSKQPGNRSDSLDASTKKKIDASSGENK